MRRTHTIWKEVFTHHVMIEVYAHNPQGQRIKKTVNGTVIYYLYNQHGLAAEYDSAGNLIKEYHFHPQKTWMTDPLFQRTANNTIYYYQNDHLGTPQRLLSNTGAVVWQANYSAFGEAEIVINTVENNLRFPGQYFDAETNLHHNYFRDYDPAIGRYIQSDPIGLEGGINTYAYVYGNPMIWVDPLGLLTIQGARNEAMRRVLDRHRQTGNEHACAVCCTPDPRKDEGLDCDVGPMKEGDENTVQVPICRTGISEHFVHSHPPGQPTLSDRDVLTAKNLGVGVTAVEQNGRGSTYIPGSGTIQHFDHKY